MGLSDVVGGTPGNSIFSVRCFQDIVINEILANTSNYTISDYVELYNLSNFKITLQMHPDRYSDTINLLFRKELSYNHTVILYFTIATWFWIKRRGDTIYLKAPDGERVIDVIRFEFIRKCFYGRYPDGASECIY
jgi:hypothetical protein